MADLSPTEHRERSLALLDRGSHLPASSTQRVGLLLESLTHATLALSAPSSAPATLTAVEAPTPLPADEPTPSKAPRRTRTTVKKETPAA